MPRVVAPPYGSASKTYCVPSHEYTNGHDSVGAGSGSDCRLETIAAVTATTATVTPITAIVVRLRLIDAIHTRCTSPTGTPYFAWRTSEYSVSLFTYAVDRGSKRTSRPSRSVTPLTSWCSAPVVPGGITSVRSCRLTLVQLTTSRA